MEGSCKQRPSSLDVFIARRAKTEQPRPSGLGTYPKRIALKGRPTVGRYSQGKRSSKASRWRFRILRICSRDVLSSIPIRPPFQGDSLCTWFPGLKAWATLYSPFGRLEHTQKMSKLPGVASNAPPQSKMESQSNYGDMDPIKSISNILREPTPLSPPASQSGDESSQTAAGSATIAAHDAAQAASDSSRSRRSGALLWRLLVLCVQPISSRLRNYLVGPLHAKLDDHAAETQADSELIQVQLKLIRADLEYLPKQLAQVEVRYQSLAKQLAELESKLGILTDQLKNLESKGVGTVARHKPAEDPDAA